MDDSSHNLAVRLAAEAADLLAEGKTRLARARYVSAAAAEKTVYAGIGPDRPRTLGIIALSAASLLYKAGDLEGAERFLYSVLSRDEIQPPHRRQLKELLEAVLDELTLPDGFKYSGQEIVVSLRGGSIGHGTAPFETALRAGTDVKSLCFRAIELESGLPFRRTSVPSPLASERVQARATQPSAGSYRFSIRLIEKVQGELFESDRGASSVAVTNRLFQVLRAIERNDSRDLVATVADRDYRVTMQKIVRNLLAADESVGEVLVARQAPSSSRRGGDIESVLLTRQGARWVSMNVRADASEVVAERDHEMRGVLRAVDLDKKSLAITDDTGKTVKLDSRDEPVDDVVGPMVNRRVIVRGRWRNRGIRKVFRLRDIELDGAGK